MTAIAAIGAVAELAPTASAGPLAAGNMLHQSGVPGDFAAMLQRGLGTMDAKVADADRMVARFALDDSIPVHQVTIALEEARLSVELAMQVRQRVVESYKELMNMQL